MPQKWMSIKEATQSLGLSDATIRRRIKDGQLPSKLNGNKRLVLVSENDEASQTQSDLIEQLKSENEYLRKELSESRERSDTIVLQLTRQVDQSQRMLEYHQEPWWKRWRRKRANEAIQDHIE